MRPGRSVTVRIVGAVILVWLAPWAGGGISRADEWSQWRGPARSGAVASPPLLDVLPAEGLPPLWVSAEDFGGGGWASPVVAEGRVFVYTHRQRLKEGAKPPLPQYPLLADDKKAAMSPQEIDAYEELRVEEQMTRLREFFDQSDVVDCLDAKTGATLWTHSRSSGPTRWRQSSTPACHAGRLYFMGADRAMVCLEINDGRPRWVTPLPFEAASEEPPVSSPVVVDGCVVVGAGRLLAYHAETGDVVWQGDRERTGGIYSSPTVWIAPHGRFVIAQVAKGRTICIEAKSGREAWIAETFAERSSPTVVGDLLYTFGGSRKGGLRCLRLSPSGAEELWRNQRLADTGSSPAVAEGLVFVQADRQISCVDAANGEIRWSEPLQATDPRYTSPVLADGKVFFAAEGVLCLRAAGDRPEVVFDGCMLGDGRLVSRAAARSRLNMAMLEETAEGRQRAEQAWHKEVVGAGPMRCVTPALSDGRLYLRTSNRLVCHDIAKP